MYRWILRHEQTILRVTQWLLLASVATPLLLHSSLLFPFITTKVFFVRFITVFAGIGYGMLVVVAPKRYRPSRDMLTIALLAFVAWVAAASLFGVDVGHSWWSDYERMLGVFTLLHYLALYLMVTALFRDAAVWRRLWWGTIIAGTLVFLGAVAQAVNPDFLAGGARTASTLGNPIYLAAYAVFVGFIAAYVLPDAWQTRTHAGVQRFLPFVLIGVIALAVFSLLFSETRGALVGLFIALVWMGVVVALSRVSRVFRWSALGMLAFVGVVAALIVWGSDTPLMRSVPGLRRLADVSITGATETRLRTWRVALEAWQDRPIVGWGWMNFAMAYDARFDPEQLKHGLQETWVDQAHNMPVEILTTTGAVGFALYLVLWGAAFRALWRAYRRGAASHREWVVFSGLLIFHFVQNLFVFEHPTSLLTLVIIFAWIAHRADDTTRHETGEPLVSREQVKVFVVGGAALLLVFAYYTNVIPIRANVLQVRAGEALHRGDLGVWFGGYQQALLLPTPYRTDMRGEMVRELLGVTQELVQLPRRAVDELVSFVASELRKNADEHPNNVRNVLEYGELLSYKDEQFREEHPEAGPEAVRVYERARLLSPRRQQVGFLQASAVLAISDFQKAKNIIYGVRALSPGIAEVHLLAAELFERAGLFEDALPSYEAAIGIAGSPQSLFRTLDDWQKVGLLHIEYGDPLRGSWMLETMVSCATGRVSWRPCVEEGDLAGFTTFRPSRKAFGALVLYYEKTGNKTRSEFFRTLATEYYADFEVKEGE